MIVKFDGKDIKEMRDLPKIVADTPVGKDVPVVIIRKGKEETKTVRLGRLEDTPQPASVKRDAAGRRSPSCRRRSGSTSPHERRAAPEVQDQGRA